MAHHPFYIFLFFWVNKGMPLLLRILKCDEEFILNDKTKKVVKALDLGTISSDF